MSESRNSQPPNGGGGKHATDSETHSLKLTRRDVNRFLMKMEALSTVLPGDMFTVLVTHSARPDVAEYAEAKGFALFYSYEF